jgi:hypothetical protein
MWSTPWMSPFATEGAAPSTMTNVIASSLSLKRRIARGNQAIEGIVCRPMIREPIAERITANRETRIPIATPMAAAMAKPQIARRIVIQIAPHI